MLEKQNALHLPIFCSFIFFTNFPEYQGIRSKKIIYKPRTADTIQLFVAIKASGLFFFWTSRGEGEFPRNYLINAFSCLSVYRLSSRPWKPRKPWMTLNLIQWPQEPWIQLNLNEIALHTLKVISKRFSFNKNSKTYLFLF